MSSAMGFDAKCAYSTAWVYVCLHAYTEGTKAHYIVHSTRVGAFSACM